MSLQLCGIRNKTLGLLGLMAMLEWRMRIRASTGRVLKDLSWVSMELLLMLDGSCLKPWGW
jgi:hypothetical protein